ncbi:hypothetical protein ACFLUV_01100 [Elusimicrobiota bacterium]
MNKFKALLLVFLLCAANVWGMGILSPFTECKLNDIEPGKKYSIKETTRKTVKIKNTGKEEIKVVVKAVKPSGEELKEGYMVIPDTGWVLPEKENITIGPGEWGETDLFISIPKDKKYCGNSYQAYISMETAGSGRIQAGLKSPLLLSVEEYKPGIFKKIWRKIWK